MESKTLSYLSFFFFDPNRGNLYPVSVQKEVKTIILIPFGHAHTLYGSKKAPPRSGSHDGDVVAQFHSSIALHPHCPCLKRLAV